VVASVVELVVVEGNYLLPEGEDGGFRACPNEVWCLDTPDEVCIDRLRHP
jgi:hypothetical protein